jgi:hypothetical protein
MKRSKRKIFGDCGSADVMEMRSMAFVVLQLHYVVMDARYVAIR